MPRETGFTQRLSPIGVSVGGIDGPLNIAALEHKYIHFNLYES
jgi:hypothetical protein